MYYTKGNLQDDRDMAGASAPRNWTHPWTPPFPEIPWMSMIFKTLWQRPINPTTAKNERPSSCGSTAGEPLAIVTSSGGMFPGYPLDEGLNAALLQSNDGKTRAYNFTLVSRSYRVGKPLNRWHNAVEPLAIWLMIMLSQSGWNFHFVNLFFAK